MQVMSIADRLCEGPALYLVSQYTHHVDSSMMMEVMRSYEVAPKDFLNCIVLYSRIHTRKRNT